MKDFVKKSKKFVYQLIADDYLTFQLYSGSKSEIVAKKRKSEWILLWFISLVFGLYFITNKELALAIYFFVIAIVTFFFYSNFFSYRYKNRHRRVIEIAYNSHFGEDEVLEFYEDHLFVKNKTGEGKINLETVIEVNEISSHLFIKFDTGTSLTLPKRELDIDRVKEILVELNIPINEELGWEWK